MSIFLTAYAQSDFFGKLIFLGLYILSAVCWMVLIHKVWLTSQVKKLARTFQKRFAHEGGNPLFLKIDTLPSPKHKEVPDLFTELFLSFKEKTLEILDKNRFFAQQMREEEGGSYLTPTDLDLIESHVWTTLSSQGKKLERNLFILSTIVTLAPFLGLLGTVWGILVTFTELHAGSSHSSSVVLGGLSTALATTVLGLVIAIPALIGYTYLKNTLRELSSDREDLLYLLLSRLEIHYRKVDVS